MRFFLPLLRSAPRSSAIIPVEVTDAGIVLLQNTGQGSGAAVTYGTAPGTACQGNDARLADARTPTTHAHAQGDVTGLVTTLAGKSATGHGHATSEVTGLDTALAGKVGTGDSRLSDARMPLTHGHAQADVTGLATALSGKEPALGSGTTAQFLRGDKTWAEPPAGGGLTLAQVLAAVYPVGCIYQSEDPTNPATVFGFGTWTALGAGRVLVGYDAADTDFNAARKTVGAKAVASAGTVGSIAASGTAAVKIGTSTSSAAASTHTHAAPSFTGTATSVVQPAIVCYRWERTA